MKSPPRKSLHPLARLDRRYVWHPFTQMRDWLRRAPVIIARGRGAALVDVAGREYLDANASIWTNLHGHAHPRINAALTRQLRKIAHSSALGLANEPASLLAERLVKLANRVASRAQRGKGEEEKRGDTVLAAFPSAPFPLRPFSHPPLSSPAPLSKVFFSDDGSTAMEVALKLAYEFARRSGLSRAPRFLSLQGAYHGDTVGAVSLGHIDMFHRAYAGLLFKSDAVMAPYCYRCPFNRARPERADAREYRRCNWECVRAVEQRFDRARRAKKPYAGMVVEPLMQGAAGMIPQPRGWLRRVAEIVRGNGALLIADEVMTSFGRVNEPGIARRSPLFGCHEEGVQPDFLAVAKGLTGGYLPMAATLTTQAVFDAFLGEYAEFKTFFHGHSFTGNQLGSAAALASLDLLEGVESQRQRLRVAQSLARESDALWQLPAVGDVRRVGLVVGVELVKNWRTREAFDLRERAGIRVCEAMARRGVLTRPIGNVVAILPPYCTTPAQVRRIFAALRESIGEVLGERA